MAIEQAARNWPAGQQIDLFHSTSEVDQGALDRLATAAQSADVRLRVPVDARDGHLTGERLRATVPTGAMRASGFAARWGSGRP